MPPTPYNRVNDKQIGEGKFSQLGLWKLKQKLWPNVPDHPIAKYYDENETLDRDQKYFLFVLYFCTCFMSFFYSM